MSGCGCDRCTGISVRTPVEVINAPALGTIRHRVGGHGEFLATLLARLSSPAYPAVRGLTVRAVDDPAIALLDASAVLADLLTFYTERIANEGYLRTATDERSLALLGRLVGYLPRPGVSAGTYLAYQLDADPRRGRDLEVRIPRGSRAQSVPGPGEEPQAFETMEELPARHSWNELRVRLRSPYQLTFDGVLKRDNVHAAGVATNLKPGDRLLYVFGAEPGRQQLDVVTGIELDRDKNVTVIGRQRLPLPSLLALRIALRKLLDPLVAQPPPDDVERSVILQRFVAGVLKPLWDKAGKDETGSQPEEPGELTTPTKYADALAQVLERLAEALEVAARYQRIRNWLQQVGGRLDALLRQARELEPPQPPAPAQDRLLAEPLFDSLGLGKALGTDLGAHRGTSLGAGRGTDRGTDRGADLSTDTVSISSAVRGLGALIGALRTPPTRPPGSTRDLVRDPGTLYAPGSDLAAQLLATLDPRIRDGLYPAWRSIDLTRPLALRDLLAMRVVATPYGATAPLRAIAQADGTIRQEEWSLQATLVLRLKVEYDDTGKPVDAEFSFSADAETWRGTDDLGEDRTLPFGPGTLAIEHTESTVSFAFEKELPKRQITVFHVDDQGGLRFTITNGINVDHTFPAGPDYRDYERLHDGVLVTVKRVVNQDDSAPQEAPQPGAAPQAASYVQFELRSFALAPRNVLPLDAVYDGIGPDSWVVVERPRKGGAVPGDPDLARVTARVTGSRVISRQAFGMSGKVTELVLDRPWMDERDTLLSQIRDATVYARGEPIRLAEEPILTDVAGDEIELAELYDGLTPGRWLIISGERTDVPGRPDGIRATELAMIAGVRQGVDENVPGDAVHTTITLATALAYRYRRDTVRLYGNVVRATHGASRDEPIGSGDAGRPNQVFSLRQGPLTWLAADTPLGAASTLEVRVDGVRWHEADSFAGRGPDERIYVTETGENGTLRVRFGDGVRGARLPTGVENVRARYRVGLGRAGNVDAGKITQLTTRPLGVSGVDNPLAANGGANPDNAGLLRRNIPLRVTAFDRLVSVPDYEDFARTRAGIGRASARRLFNGARQVVHVTVAGVDDIQLLDDSDIVTTLRATLARHGDAGLPAEVAVRELVLLVISAGVRVHPDHSWEIVEPAVRTALLDRLGFERRELGQPAYLSEVLATAQAVPGVDHVDVDVFAGVPGSITPAGIDRVAEDLTEPRPAVGARLATFDETSYEVRDEHETLTAIAAKHGISVAELLRLNPDITDVAPLEPGRSVVVFRGVRPAQLVLLSPAVPDTLILKETRP
jgi:predicted phage baseplate assembly protein